MYGRAPTTNELRALENLPLQKELYDTSPTGVRIYSLLAKAEENNDVSLLEEAGRLLWTRVTSCYPADVNRSYHSTYDADTQHPCPPFTSSEIVYQDRCAVGDELARLRMGVVRTTSRKPLVGGLMRKAPHLPLRGRQDVESPQSMSATSSSTRPTRSVKIEGAWSSATNCIDGLAVRAAANTSQD